MSNIGSKNQRGGTKIYQKLPNSTEKNIVVILNLTLKLYVQYKTIVLNSKQDLYNVKWGETVLTSEQKQRFWKH